MGNESHCLGAHEASWIHTAKGFRTPAAGTCSVLGRSAPQSGSLHSSSRHLQNPEAGKAEKEPLRKVSENVNYFAPVSKTKLFYSHPSPSISQAPPGPLPQPQPTWKTWRCQRLDGVISPQCQGKTALWEHRSPLPTAQARGCSAAMNKPWKHPAVLAPRQWQQLKLRRCLFVHLLCPQTNMQKVEKPWKGRELPTHFELL